MQIDSASVNRFTNTKCNLNAREEQRIMKMESSSTSAIESNSKSKEDLLLPSENNNTNTANGELNINDSDITNITDSVAMTANSSTSSNKSQPQPNNDSKQEDKSPSTDDSKNRVINHVEESEVIRDEVAREEDSQTVSTALQEQEGAAGDDNVARAGDSNSENQIEDKNDDLIAAEDVPSEDVEDEQCVEETIEKSEQSDKSNEENTKQVENDENIMEVDAVNADVEVKDEDTEKNDNSWTKMHLTEDISDGNQIQATSPGHTEQVPINNTIAPSTIIQRNGIVKVTNEENAKPKTKIITNGNDHTEDDDDNTTNSIKTEQVCQSKSPEYTATITQAGDLDGVVPPKRRMSSSSPQDQLAGTQSGNSKRMKITALENHDFKTRDQILNNYMENMDCTGFEGLKNNSDQLLSEIQKLGELAKMKEREWNQILHQKKLREELLLRLQRAKQIMVLQTNGSTNSKHQDQLLQRYQTQQPNQQQQQQHRQVYQQQQDVSVIDKGRQGPLLDVQKMISDYRQTHPESIPRRGRRIRGQDTPRYDSGNLLTVSNVALGSGSQVRTGNSSGSLANINQDIYNEFSLLLSSMDNDRLKTASSSSIKDLLAQFARMSASERQDLLNSVKGPHNVTSGQSTSYPEVTVHPVQQSAAPVAPSTSNSLLHGILTKARNEITITPVQQYEDHSKSMLHHQDDEGDDGTDRLVIDEGDGHSGRSKQAEEEAAEEVPQCQGCNHKAAQFVCAGCGNQWYCSRECQVSAWDEHSEVCSG